MSEPSDFDPLDDVIEAFLARLRAGERPAIDDVVAAHPQLTSRIRELFPALVEMEAVCPPAGPDTAEEPPRRLGDYRILRQIGRGGMGVVYEAVQESLGRHVALKVLPARAAADPAYLERFSREARSAARLHHGNIVPVYEVGEDAGVSYYAMQYIPGQALDGVLREVMHLRHDAGSTTASFPAVSLLNGFEREPPQPAGPSPEPPSALAKSSPGAYYRGVARIALQVAEALAYAHRQGIVHRDVKPANLLLDLNGQAWVTDFGLARAEDADHLTTTGDIVGTMRYMAPERFDGVTDPRGDIYSLGLTLYEMLTLRPAFREADRSRLLHAILKEPPPAPRAIDPGIPADLETIVLKAIEKRAEDRFGTATELADELRRFLADEPLRIRRVGLVEQLWRWRRRNAAVANLTFAVAVLGAVLFASFAFTWVVRRERDLARISQERAEEAEGRAVIAERETRLRNHLARAAARLHRGGVGQRFGTLAELRQALALSPSPEAVAEMRTLALSALSRPDVEVGPEWDGWPAGTVWVAPFHDGDRFARLAGNGEVVIGRQTSTGEEVLLTVPPHGTAPFRKAIVSTDGKYLCVCHGPPNPHHHATSAAFTVWDLTAAKPEPILDEARTVYEMAAVFHPARPLLAVPHRENAVSVYDLTARRCVQHVAVPSRPHCVGFAPGARDDRLAVSAGGMVHIVHAETGEVERRFRLPEEGDWVYTLDWHPDGRLMAGCSDRLIRVWDTRTGRPALTPIAGHLTQGVVAVFNREGDRITSNDWNASCKYWDAHTGRLLLKVPGIVLFHKLADGGRGLRKVGEKTAAFRFEPGRELRLFRRSARLGENQIRVNWSLDPAGRVLGVYEIDDSRLHCFDFSTGKELLSTPLPPECEPTPVAPNLTGGTIGVIRWPARWQGDCLHYGPPQWVVPPRASVAAQSADGNVVLTLWYDRQPPKVIRLNEGGRAITLGKQFDIRHLGVSPDGRLGVLCSHHPAPDGKQCRVWDLRTGRHVVDLPAGSPCVGVFSPDGRLLYVGDGRARLFDTATWTVVRDLGLVCPAFSPDGRLLAIAELTGEVRIEEAATGRELARLVPPEPIVIGSVRFSPDGAHLLAVHGEFEGVYSWDLALLRRGLADLGLDWDHPPLTPTPPRPATLRVDFGELQHFIDYPDPHRAVALWSVALGLQPLHPEGYYHRGRAYERLDLPGPAKEDYTRFLGLCSPDDPQRAEVLLRRGTRGDLLALTGTKLDGFARLPQLAEALAGAAWELVVEGTQARDAERLARKAVELYPGNAAYRRALAAALFGQGRWREAWAELAKGERWLR